MVMRETIGGYPILGEIGSGYFGTVYRARDPLSGQDVALKVLTDPGTGFNDPERFKREAKLPYEIGHPNIIRMFHYGEDGSDHFIVMELMQVSLQEILGNGRLSLSRSVDICRQVALGLRAAHNHEIKITHRDVKPNNILIDSNGVVKVSDFGIAHADNLPGLTATGVGFGPIGYMSPEQAMDAKGVDGRADIYSLGATLYHMLTGKRYELDESAKASRPAIPGELERIVNKCLKMERERRYQNMDGLLREIANPELINRCALIDFYEAAGGTNWRRSDNWLTDTPLIEWFGVTANLDGTVTELHVPSNYLAGEVSSEIGHLSELASLEINDNRLSGSIPPEIGDLTKLSTLSLHDNYLSGSIPPEIGNLTDLINIHLNDNHLSGSIPPEVGNLTELESLEINDNRLSGSIPPEIGNLINVQYIGLGGNRLSGNIPSEICNAYFDYLDLSGNCLSGSIPPEISNLSLGSLDLSDNRLSGSIPPEIDASFMFEIKLSGNNWTGCIPRSLFGISDNDLDEINLPVCDD